MVRIAKKIRNYSSAVLRMRKNRDERSQMLISPVVGDRAKLPEVRHTLMKVHRSRKHGANLKVPKPSVRSEVRAFVRRACVDAR